MAIDPQRVTRITEIRVPPATLDAIRDQLGMRGASYNALINAALEELIKRKRKPRKAD